MNGAFEGRSKGHGSEKPCRWCGRPESEHRESDDGCPTNVGQYGRWRDDGCGYEAFNPKRAEERPRPYFMRRVR